MNPFQFSMLQQPFNIHRNLNQITDYNPFGMGIPNNSQTAPYLQYSPYQPGQSPYTQWFGNQIANQGYDPNYYSNLMELMNKTPTAQYIEPFQQVAEDARTAQQVKKQPVPKPKPEPEPIKKYWISTSGWGDRNPGAGRWSLNPETYSDWYSRMQSH